MIVSKYKRKLIEAKKKKAIMLYKQGLTTRDVGKVIHRSHSWVADVVKKIKLK